MPLAAFPEQPRQTRADHIEQMRSDKLYRTALKAFKTYQTFDGEDRPAYRQAMIGNNKKLLNRDYFKKFQEIYIWSFIKSHHGDDDDLQSGRDNPRLNPFIRENMDDVVAHVKSQPIEKLKKAFPLSGLFDEATGKKATISKAWQMTQFDMICLMQIGQKDGKAHSKTNTCTL